MGLSNRFGHELRVISAAELLDDTGQTPGVIRRAGIDRTSTHTQQLWMGRVSCEPGMVSAPHHHGEAETAGFVLSGTAHIYYGDDFVDYVVVREGEMVYVPSHLPHIEANGSKTRPLEFLTTRSPDNIVVNLSLPDAWKPAGILD